MTVQSRALNQRTELSRAAAMAGAERLAKHSRDLKEDSRERLLTAAVSVFSEQGYFDATVDRIARAANVSRITFYRHFRDKAAAAIAVYERDIDAAMPQFLSIRDEDYQDRGVVLAWVRGLFERPSPHPKLLRAYAIAAAVEPEFFTSARALIGRLIVEYGLRIPAFAAAAGGMSEGSRVYVEAWLVLYEILHQSNHFAMSGERIPNPHFIEVLADRFLRFADGEAGQEGASGHDAVIVNQKTV